MISVILPDGSKREFSSPPTLQQVAEAIGSRLANEAVAGRVNNSSDLVDLRTEVSDGDRVEIVTLKDSRANEVLRHSAAHIMAEAVQSLWPEVKVTIGPVIENGFYYDFDSERKFTPEDLLLIEQKMEEIIRKNEIFTRSQISSAKAAQLFEGMGERFKVEIIRDLNSESVTLYHQGKWFDLCRGPHVQRASQIKAIKLLSIAGAYWRGDESKGQLQRIYGTAFTNKKDLELYLERIEEAKRRDHRRLGKDLGLFYFHPYAPGSPFFTGKGTIIYRELQGYIRELYRRVGYQEVISPQIFDVDLYHRSGHYENYRENMYFVNIDERDFSIKPMNCPGHCLLFDSERRSYRDLPFRMADFGRLHRHERSGVLHGLTRVRTFCQDDAHIFCRKDQLQGEIESFVKLLQEVYEKLGMSNYRVFLSTRPEKRIGSDEVWDFSENALKEALIRLGMPFEINAGDGAFYGPKLDVMFVDALDRGWQLGTLQCDFNMPERFELKYVGEDNQAHQPVMLHRAILGSLERFIGVYMEHCGGRLPTWLSPVQVEVLTITDHQKSYALGLVDTLKEVGVRAHLDDRNEKLGFKVREAQIQKVPYIVIVGDKEVQNSTLSVRLKGGNVIQGLGYQQVVDAILLDIGERRLEGPTEIFNNINQEEDD